MEAVAKIAREDAVPIGPIHNMVIVLRQGSEDDQEMMAPV